MGRGFHAFLGEVAINVHLLFCDAREKQERERQIVEYCKALKFFKVLAEQRKMHTKQWKRGEAGDHCLGLCFL
jgi:hypothetical protein